MPAIIFKPTEACNSNCAYCDVITNKAPKTMSLDVLEKVFLRIGEYLDSPNAERTELIWHGGEPLLLKPYFFEEAIRLQEKYCGNHPEMLCHAIQTNLTLLKETHIDLFKKLGITQVGTSYEPIEGIRGLGATRDSILYNHKFLDALEILEKHGIGWGFIYVVTRRAIADPSGLFYKLANFTVNGSFSMNPVLIYGEDVHQLAITNEEYADFLGAILKEWWPVRDRFPNVEPFRSYLRNYEGARCLGCCDSGECSFMHLYIGPEGEASQCGRSGDWGILNYGNINDSTLYELLHHPDREILKQRKSVLPKADCQGCPYWEICHGGCPLDAWHGHGTFHKKTDWCLSKKLFLKNYFEPITGLTFN